MRTFWYLRLLGPPGLMKNVTALISEPWILKGKNPRHKSKHPYSIWPYSIWPKTLLDSPKYHQTPYKHSPVLQEQPSPLPNTSQPVWEAFVWSRVVRGTLGELRLPDDVCWVSGMFVSAFRNASGVSVLIWVFFQRLPIVWEFVKWVHSESDPMVTFYL